MNPCMCTCGAGSAASTMSGPGAAGVSSAPAFPALAVIRRPPKGRRRRPARRRKAARRSGSDDRRSCGFYVAPAHTRGGTPPRGGFTCGARSRVLPVGFLWPWSSEGRPVCIPSSRSWGVRPAARPTMFGWLPCTGSWERNTFDHLRPRSGPSATSPLCGVWYGGGVYSRRRSLRSPARTWSMMVVLAAWCSKSSESPSSAMVRGGDAGTASAFPGGCDPCRSSPTRRPCHAA